MSEEATLDIPVTSKVYFNVSIGNDADNIMVFELFPNVALEEVRMFCALCSAKRKLTPVARRPIQFNECFFKRIGEDMVEGSLIADGEPALVYLPEGKEKGESVSGESIPNEMFSAKMTHDGRGLLTMSLESPHKFGVTFKAVPHLDRQFEVLGKIVHGLDVLRKMENVNSSKIIYCGLTPVWFSEKQLKQFTRNYEKDISLGSFGSVYSGNMGEQAIAVKRSHIGELWREWQQEIDHWSEIGHHKHIIELLGYSCSDNVEVEGEWNEPTNYEQTLYLVYPLYPRCLYDAIRRDPFELKLCEVVQIIKGIASGLEWMHSKQWIHCDLKPENILLDERCEAVIIDFGNMALAGRPHRGTLGYHDYRTARNACPRSDLYSLGVVMLQMLMKRMTVPDLIYKVVKEPFRRTLVHDSIGPNRKSRKAGGALIELALKCIDPLPLSRPTSMRDFIERFDKIVASI